MRPTGEDIGALFAQEIREKRRARGGQVVAKKRPGVVYLPDSRVGGYWQVAAVLVKVDIGSGQVLVNRWPLLADRARQ